MTQMTRISLAPPNPQAATVAALLCVDPLGTAGVVLRHCSQEQRDAWLQLVTELMPPAATMRVMPLSVQEDRLLGGLDLSATLVAGRPVVQTGLLAEVDGGMLVLNSADRLSQRMAAHLAAALDAREVVVERAGAVSRRPARFGLIAFDGGVNEEEHPPEKLMDRLAFRLDFAQMVEEVGEVGKGEDVDDAVDSPARAADRDDVAAARLLLADVEVGEEMRHAVCEAASALGVDSIRASVLAMRVARANAALQGRLEVLSEDAALAVRLVLLPRATMLPAHFDASESVAEESAADESEPPEQDDANAASPENDQENPPSPNEAETEAQDDADSDADTNADTATSEIVLEAALAALPRGLLDSLKIRQAAPSTMQSAGRAGAASRSTQRGRPDGVRAGLPRDGMRLNLIETLRAAAPWQPMRRKRVSGDAYPASATGIHLRREDFRVTRYKQRTETTTLFVVDASGSAALQRLAEAKGAVELLLADCYVRRDSVSLVGFRGRSAEVLLPVTRSLVRAKRSLAGLAGGGGTPLAAAIDMTLSLAQTARRQGRTPVAVLLTDGRANVARDGIGGRPKAIADAMDAARQMRAAGITALVLDTSPQPQPSALQLATEMGAVYLPLPYADAVALSGAVRAATEGQRAVRRGAAA